MIMDVPPGAELISATKIYLDEMQRLADSGDMEYRAYAQAVCYELSPLVKIAVEERKYPGYLMVLVAFFSLTEYNQGIEDVGFSTTIFRDGKYIEVERRNDLVGYAMKVTL